MIASLLYLLAVIRRQKALAEIKNDLISNITHEFKTPIATIGVALEAIESFSGEEQNQRTHKYVQMSTEQLERLNGMVEKLLDTASLDRGEVILNTEPTNLVAMLDRLIHSEAMVQSGKQLNFESETEEILYPVDPFHFENAINNILDNAVKYGGDKIDLHIGRNTEAVVIRIQDSGNGLSGEHRKRIFEKFYRIPAGNTHDVKGYGIGLYYSLSMIEKHGGQLQLISTEPTTFEIRLPHE
ncbi:sensor histidine kinase [Aureitalea marina]|uniref:histidine kinase n=1 Tax=Aureitalea marina TaxID=930804 RepID=A0A2S7KR04_9FLAO|nr:HAMP domain-containing sensor histidine kinase [Aureitalea marina]PQB05051.1 hypothetical protein BST85_09205 [Aureitalea marina]